LDQTFSFGEPATIVRTRGTLWVKSDQEAATESPLGAFGMAVVRDEAVAIGVTAIPLPETDSDSDAWFLWMPWAYSIVRSATGLSTDAMARYDFDSKAMRKVDDADTAVVVMQNSAATHGVNFVTLFRMLVKLHG